jgi:energy-coupling factor transport system substrate-specific component
MSDHKTFFQSILSISILGLTTIIGVFSFIYPFLVPSLRDASLGQAHVNDAPLLTVALVGLCFIVLLLEVQGQTVNAKFVALLGVLVSMNALLRFLDVAIPGPGGLSPIFFLIILAGYVFGGRFGFLMGALTLLVSTLITGAVGPWLPYQMFAAGWVGLSAPLCRPLVRAIGGTGKRLEILVLAAFAGFWGVLFGIVMNVWFWPFAIGPADQYWEPGIGLAETITRYAVFYATTSLAWDVLRAFGNVVLMVAFGAAALQALRRFHRRFAFDYVPAGQIAGEPKTVAHVRNDTLAHVPSRVRQALHYGPEPRSGQRRARQGRAPR